ncbi:unnamed protein product, partial [Hapterophycus canaliculatus]
QFGEESCRTSASIEDVKRIVGADVYEAQRRRLEGLSGACEECGHRGRRPSKHSPSPTQQRSLSPPTLRRPSRPPPGPPAAAGAVATHEEADAQEEHTCQSCGSVLRRHHHHHHHLHLPHPHYHHHHHHHHQEHCLQHDRTPSRGTAAGSTTSTRRKYSVKTPRRSREPSPELRQQRRRGKPLFIGGRGAAGESTQLEKQEREGDETAGAPAIAAATIRCRGCPTCGHRQQQVSHSSSGRWLGKLSTGDGTKNTTISMTTRPITDTLTTPATPATTATTATAMRQRVGDVQDNLVVCNACGGAWCWLCGRSASDGINVVGGGDSRSGGYSKASNEHDVEEEMRKLRDNHHKLEPNVRRVASSDVARNGGRLQHFSRWNVAGCPGARHTDPKGWDGECLALYRALVTILVVVVGPVFLVSRAMCWLVGVVLAPVCCAFGAASSSMPDVICFPVAVALSLFIAVAWLPLGLVAAATRWLWMSVAFRDTRPDGDGGGGGGGDVTGDNPVGRVAQARQRRVVSAAKAKMLKEAKTLKLVAIAPAIVLSSYLASWWWWEGSNGSGGGSSGGGRRGDIAMGVDENGTLSEGRRERRTRSRTRPPQQEQDPHPHLEETPVLLTIAAKEGISHETPPLTATSV